MVQRHRSKQCTVFLTAVGLTFSVVAMLFGTAAVMVETML